MTPEQLREALTRFTGTENWYQHQLGIRYTDGVQFLAEHAGTHWLIDAIASHQPRLSKRSDPALAEFQLWRLAVADDKSARLTCRADSNQPAVVVHRIPFTDFPLDSITLYLERGVLLLPSEH